MNEVILIDNQTIENKIYTIRGVQVMVDKDLALLYDVKPTRFREQVRRNSKKFPEDFMFELAEKEVEYMVSQNAIPSKQHLGGSMPLVFTVQGVSMLDTVLRSDIIAIDLYYSCEKTLKSILAYQNKKILKSHDLIEIYKNTLDFITIKEIELLKQISEYQTEESYLAFIIDLYLYEKR